MLNEYGYSVMHHLVKYSLCRKKDSFDDVVLYIQYLYCILILQDYYY